MAVHKHTKRPQYGQISEWDDDPTDDWRQDVHGVSRAEHGAVAPVVFDIETTAETPQRPIIVTVYDSKPQHLHVAYVRGYQGFKPDADQLADRAAEAMGSYPVADVTVHHTVTQSWFENWVLQNVHNDAEKALVGHNVFFDMGILASPDPGAFDAFGLDPNDWDGAMTYRDLTCTFKRAGAFGKLYSWRPQRNIPVIDTQVLAKSMWHSSGLSALAEEYGIGGVEPDQHGELTEEYLLYNVDDVRQTMHVYEELIEELQTGFNTDMTGDKVFSTASIAKDVLSRMGYDRSHYTEQAAGVIAPSYFGGNTEALQTGELIEDVTYMDILSQYPTVAGLCDVWRYMRAETVDVSQVAPETLPRPTAADLQQPEAWREIAPYYVAVESDGSTLPIRTSLEGTGTTRVYNAEVTHDGATTVHHLMDVIGAQIRGEDVQIRKAWKAEKIGEQSTQAASVGDTQIGAKDNVMVRSIEERKRLQQVFGGKNQKTKSLKITANSCYGISAERIVEEDGDPGAEDHCRYDVAGKLYNPHVASTITAGGRLMLSLGEVVAEQHGGQLYYCDTDSLIVDDHVAADVQAAFADLNPYEQEPVASAEVLEIEEGKDGKPLESVSLFALGVKKYAVLDQHELIKYTEHGLGAFECLRGSEAVQQFWRTLLTRFYNVDVHGSTFTAEQVQQPLIWQQTASTELVRQTVNDYLSDQFRFGDWVQRVIDTAQDGRRTVYLGIDVTEEAVKIEETQDGLSTEQLAAEDLQGEELKRVLDLLSEWHTNEQIRSQQYGERPSVVIEDTAVVTKEASTEKMALGAMVSELLHVTASMGLLFD